MIPAHLLGATRELGRVSLVITMGSASSARQTSSTTAARLRPRAGPASSRTDRSAQGRESPAVRAASLPSPFSPYGADHQHAPSIVSSPSHRRARHVPSTGLSPLRDAVFIPRRPRQRDGPYRRPAEAASRERYHRSTTSSTSTRRPAQFEPAWGLLAAVAGVAVDVDVHGAQRATGMGRRSCCRPWRIRPARRGELRAHRQGARRRPCGLCPRPTRAPRGGARRGGGGAARGPGRGGARLRRARRRDGGGLPRRQGRGRHDRGRGRCVARPRASLLRSVQCRKEASSWQNAHYRSYGHGSSKGVRDWPAVIVLTPVLATLRDS